MHLAKNQRCCITPTYPQMTQILPIFKIKAPPARSLHRSDTCTGLCQSVTGVDISGYVIVVMETPQHLELMKWPEVTAWSVTLGLLTFVDHELLAVGHGAMGCWSAAEVAFPTVRSTFHPASMPSDLSLRRPAARGWPQGPKNQTMLFPKECQNVSRCFKRLPHAIS